MSFDRNYYSAAAKKQLNIWYDKVILPKPGKKTENQKAEESETDYAKKRRAHSGIEANINQLACPETSGEHHGLDKCRNKGIDGFKSYVGLGVLAYNLHQMPVPKPRGVIF